MNLQARRISGSTFTAEDKLEVSFNSDNQPISSVVHTIELVSGINVTHGGGGQPGEYLHYKPISDEVIDYSSVDMFVSQVSKGTSIIKVVCQIITVAQVTEYESLMNSWQADNVTAINAGEVNPDSEPSEIVPTILKTGEITLDWSEDSFV